MVVDVCNDIMVKNDLPLRGCLRNDAREMTACKTHPVCLVRGALLTKGSDSSFAEARRGFNSEPTHTEHEVEDQEDEVEEMRETVKSAKWRVEERSDTQAHETWMG